MSYHITQNERSFLQGLSLRKNRYEYRQFLVEGIKPVLEALTVHFPIINIYVSSELSASLPYGFYETARRQSIPINVVPLKEIERIGTLKNPEGIIAVGCLSPEATVDVAEIQLPAVYLWEINNPGNLGTIIRTMLWFGIWDLILSPGSVDAFSPKVVRGSMGALFHLRVFTDVPFCTIQKMISDRKACLFSADMSGVLPDGIKVGEQWIIVFGGESHGLPDEILRSSDKIFGIPKKGYGESLNLGVSVGIILNELMNK